MTLAYSFGRHIRQEHWKGKKKWTNCWQCWLMYSASFSLYPLTSWAASAEKMKIKYNLLNIMQEIVIYILVVIGISTPPIIAVWLDHYFNKKKKAAETKKIQLQNKITEEITYGQLKTESKQKDIKGKIGIFQQLLALEEQIKNKKEKTDEDQKKLESLEMIKKEFKQTFEEEKNPELTKEKLETKKKFTKKLTPKEINPRDKEPKKLV